MTFLAPPMRLPSSPTSANRKSKYSASWAKHAAEREQLIGRRIEQQKVIARAFARVGEIESKQPEEQTERERTFSDRMKNYEHLFALNSGRVNSDAVRIVQQSINALDCDVAVPQIMAPDPAPTRSAYELYASFLVKQRAAMRDDARAELEEDDEGEGAEDEDDPRGKRALPPIENAGSTPPVWVKPDAHYNTPEQRTGTMPLKKRRHATLGSPEPCVELPR